MRFLLLYYYVYTWIKETIYGMLRWYVERMDDSRFKKEVYGIGIGKERS